MNENTTRLLEASCPAAFCEEPAAKCSKRYEFVDTVKALETLETLGWQPTSASQKGNKTTGAHMVRLQNRDALYDTPEGRFELILMNSCDGSVKFQLRVGIYRFACMNGMVVGTDLLTPVSIKHIVYNREALKSALDTVYTNFDTVYAHVIKMMATPCDFEGQRDLLLAGIDARWSRAEGTPKGFNSAKLLFVKREADRLETVWNMLNRVQENLVRGQYKNCRTLKDPIKVLKVNNALWNAAEKLVA